MLLIAVCFSLLAVVGAQLKCAGSNMCGKGKKDSVINEAMPNTHQAKPIGPEPTTSHYRYVNDIKMFGAAAQSFVVSVNVEIDCEGDSKLSNETYRAFDYTAHFSNATVTDKNIKPENVANLCGKKQPNDGTCKVGDGSKAGDTEEERINDMTDQLKLPLRFTQTDSGIILRVLFMEKDFERKDVMDMKKGIISSLQTKITEPGETTERETDSTGAHTATFKSKKSGNGLHVEKEFKVDSDQSSKSKAMKTAAVRVKTKTVIEDGEVADSSGELNAELEKDDELEPDESEDTAPEVKIDEVVRGSSKFNMKLTTKTTRSLSRHRRLAELNNDVFLPTSLEMDDLEDNTDQKYEKLENLYKQIYNDTTIPDIVKDFQDTGDATKLSKLRSAIVLETELGFERIEGEVDSRPDGPLVDEVVSASQGIFDKCQERWDKCRALLSLCASGGRFPTEEVLEFQLSKKSTLNSTYMVEVLNLVSFLANPSSKFVIRLVRRLNELPEDSDLFAGMILTLGSLAGHKSVDEDAKVLVRAIILKELETISTEGCSDDAGYADALEAIGNMGDIKFIDRLMEINTACGDSKMMRVALFHAMINFLDDSRVQSFMIDTLSSFECDVSQEMINLLSDEIQEQQLDENTVDNWPSTGFNRFDNVLSKYVIDTPDKLSCLRSEAIRYFGLKLAPEARDIAVSLSRNRRKEQGNRPISKRGLLKHSSCSSWGSDGGRYALIASDQTFKQDNDLFNKRKHCLAHLGLGPDKANIQIYAGFFAGYNEPVTSTQVKLFAKAVARGKVFSTTFTIATVLLYFEKSSKVTLAARVYIKVGPKVLIDQSITKPEYTNTQSLFTTPTITIPLAKIPFYISTISLDLSLDGEVKLTTHLYACGTGSNICLSFKPEAIATATGTVSISLVAVRGGADLAFSLNYYVLGVGQTRAPQAPCVSLKHGHDEATINFYFFFQRRKLGWSGFSWSDKATFAPSSLSWTIGRGNEASIYTNCG